MDGISLGVSNQVVDSIYENRDREKFYYLRFGETYRTGRGRRNGQRVSEWMDGRQIGSANSRFWAPVDKPGLGESRAVDEQLEGWSDERKEEGDPIPEPMVMMIPILHTLAVNGQ